MDSNYLVGTLTRWNPHTRQVSDPLEIYSNEEVYIGRDKRVWYVVDFLSVQLILTRSKIANM